MNSVIVSVSGVNLSHHYIVREMSIYFVGDDSTRHYFFNRPSHLQLTQGKKRTDYYTREVLGGIGILTYIPGALEYDSHRKILNSLGARYRIFFAGHVTHKFLTELMPYADIVDVQLISTFTYPKNLPNCCNGNHTPRQCSLAKLIHLKHHADEVGMFQDI